MPSLCPTVGRCGSRPLLTSRPPASNQRAAAARKADALITQGLLEAVFTGQRKCWRTTTAGQQLLEDTYRDIVSDVVDLLKGLENSGCSPLPPSASSSLNDRPVF